MTGRWGLHPEVKAALKAKAKSVLREDPVISTVRSAWRCIKRKSRAAGNQARQTQGQNSERQLLAERILSLEAQVTELREEFAKQQQTAKTCDEQRKGAANSQATAASKKPSPKRVASQKALDGPAAQPTPSQPEAPKGLVDLQADSLRCRSHAPAIKKDGLIVDWRQKATDLAERYRADKARAVREFAALSEQMERLKNAGVEVAGQLFSIQQELNRYREAYASATERCNGLEQELAAAIAWAADCERFALIKEAEAVALKLAPPTQGPVSFTFGTDTSSVAFPGFRAG